MSGIFNAAGTRLIKSGVTTSTTGLDPEVKVTMDLYDRHTYGRTDANVAGSIPRLRVKSGTVLRQSELDALFAPGQVTGITPATSALAGGQVCTIIGTGLDGVTAVTVGGTAATAVTVVNDREVRFTTPAKTAGAHAVVITDDGNTVTPGINITFA